MSIVSQNVRPTHPNEFANELKIVMHRGHIVYTYIYTYILYSTGGLYNTMKSEIIN